MNHEPRDDLGAHDVTPSGHGLGGDSHCAVCAVHIFEVQSRFPDSLRRGAHQLDCCFEVGEAPMFRPGT